MEEHDVANIYIALTGDNFCEAVSIIVANWRSFWSAPVPSGAFPSPVSLLPNPLTGTIITSWTHDAPSTCRRPCQASTLTIQDQEFIPSLPAVASGEGRVSGPTST